MKLLTGMTLALSSELALAHSDTFLSAEAHALFHLIFMVLLAGAAHSAYQWFKGKNKKAR